MLPKISNTKKIILWALIIIFAFSLGFISGDLFGSPQAVSSSLPKLHGLNEKQLLSLNQVWDIIHDQFIDQPVDDEALLQGAFRGMMESLGDPYSAYMSPEEFRAQNAPIIGEYSGIGAYVDTSGDFLVIMAPMPDSPAEMAGLKPGDKVVAIDGEDMTQLSPAEVLERIYGPAGTKINLSIQRDGIEEILQFELERAVIPIPSVESEMLEGQIGVIRLFTFGENSASEFKQSLTNLLDQKAKGLILDLRNNTGGLVDSAIEITSFFITDEVVMVEEWADGTENKYQATGNSINTEIPLVVLVNEGTASASEITAGALQDLKRAKLVGSQTFGKGFIQNWVPLRFNNGGLRITTARWLTPNGRQIQESGLTPDIQIQITDEDIQNKFDAQMNQALELLIQPKNQ